VWWVALDPTLGSEINKTRPCVVLTTNIVNQHRRTVVVIPLSTSAQESPPILVGVNSSGKHCVAVIDEIRAISKDRLRARIGFISVEHLRSIEQALREILEI
jgi:mRNA interferase MazF